MVDWGVTSSITIRTISCLLKYLTRDCDPGRQEGVSAAIQVPGKVLSGRCGGGNYPGHHPASLLSTGPYRHAVPDPPPPATPYHVSDGDPQTSPA